MPKKKSEKKQKTKIGPESSRNQKLLFLVAILLLAIVLFFRVLSLPEIHSDISLVKRLLGLVACLSLTVGFAGLAVRHLFPSSTSIDRIDRFFFCLGALGGLVLAILSFNPILAPNGDNAEYLINAKSLVERGGVYRLDTPRENYNSLAALGLPGLISPIYALWGFDIIKMKLLIFLMHMGILPLLYLLFRAFEESARPAAVLALLGWTSPYLVSASSAIMTETPFIFFSALALLLITRFSRQTTWHWKTLSFMLVAIAMTFLVRAIGLSMLGTLVLYLMVQVPWASSWKKGKLKALWTSISFQKMVWLTIPLLLASALLQLWQQSKGISQAAVFFDKDLITHVSHNLHSTKMVLGQMIFGEEIYRWFSFDSDSSLTAPGLLQYLVLFALMVGIVYGIYLKSPIALYTMLTMTLVTAGSLTPQEMVTMRYNMVLIPYFIYLFYLGVHWLIELILSRAASKRFTRYAQIATFVVLAQLLFANLSNNLFNVAKSSRGYGDAYTDFLQAARWSADNLPEDAYVASSKPRIFYVYSGRKGVRIIGSRAQYSKEYEKERLDFFKKNKVSHLVVDQASSRTQEVVFPIVDNNTDKFEMLHIPKPHGTCGIIQVNPY